MANEYDIALEQNKPERLLLLHAQRLFYARAKTRQNTFAIAALVLPTVGVFFGTEHPALRPFLGLGSILLLLLEVGVLSGMQREDCKRGAKVQEQFDTEVLCLDWNKLVAGSRVDAEDIRAIVPKVVPASVKEKLENWYERALTTLPLPLARLLCQRTNITYDMRVRTSYARILLSSAVLIAVVLTLYGLHQDLKFSGLILAAWLPALPLATFLLKEYRKQKDTIESLTTLKSEIEKAWDKALAGASDAELTVIARGLQDAIYRHRASNPLVLDWLYDRFRENNEGLTRHAIEQLVSEAKRKLSLNSEQ